MLWQAKNLKNYKLAARNGEIGKSKDIYFDDQSWTVRYLIVDTGGWLSGRQVLISPYVLDKPDDNNKVIPVSLTKEKIENSPSIDADRPVSRQDEGTTIPITTGQGTGWGRTHGDRIPFPGARRSAGPRICAARQATILISAA